MTVASRLQETKDFLLANEWCQGSFKQYIPSSPGKPRFAYCLVGALSASAPDDQIPLNWDACVRLQQAIHGDEGWQTTSVSAWNDDPGRTKEEVIALIDKAISLENEISELPA